MYDISSKMVVMRSDEWMSGYISGLVTGEGSFIISVQKSKNSRLGYSVRACLAIEMHSRDKDMLMSVATFLGVGSVRNLEARKGRVNASDTCRYEVNRIQDCLKIADFFKEHPILGGKASSFTLWCQCLEIIKSGEHHTFDGFKRIVELRQNLNNSCRTSAFLDSSEVLLKAIQVNDKTRKLSTWSSEEEKLLHDYLDKKITRSQLMELLLPRDKASIDNKLHRLRKF
jgi:LAGLIDADG endonuclease